MSIRFHIALVVSLSAGAATAAPLDYALPDAYSELRASAGQEAGRTAAQANCLACHSTDYIAMQPPGKGRAFWDVEVTKMIRVYRAPIDEADGKVIAAYLADAY